MGTALVTGASRGIGLELTRILAGRGERVIAVCRTASDELRTLARKRDVIKVKEGIDVTSDAAVAGLAASLVDVTIDTLINNAGLLTRETLEDFDLGRMRRLFEVNALGPLRITHTLLGNLRKGSKIAMITSRMGSIADNTSGHSYGYRMSKAALNIASVSLARDLAERGIAVAILHPGWVRTGMTGGTGHVEPAESARQLIARIDGLSMASTGTFWHANGQVLPW